MQYKSSRKTLYFCLDPRWILSIAVATLLASCSAPTWVKPPSRALPAQPQLAENSYTSFDGDSLGYRKWLPSKKEPKTVIIGIHGISGYSGDYKNLAKFLLKNNPDTAMYAAETRGQGMDPKLCRRGDICHVDDWYKDLHTFTGLVRKVHPKAQIVWFGESMGSLIAMHSYVHTPPGAQKPDAMIISSPIVDVNERLQPWKYTMVRTTSLLFPTLKVSLESLSGGQSVVVTEDDIHQDQVLKNEWYIKQYTLRLLLNLGNMSASLSRPASTVACPVLVLHGGKDIFTSDSSVRTFYAGFPGGTDKNIKIYPGSYHLLMYDHERDKIFADISKWLHQLK